MAGARATQEEEAEGRALEAEVRELLGGWRARRHSAWEPCAAHNVARCLAALQQEFSLLNLKYVFNPYMDLCEAVGNGESEGETLQPRALVALVNAAWTLLQHHKRSADTAEKLQQQNHILQQNNNFLNGKVEQLNAEVERRKREARACAAEGSRAAERATGASAELRAARARLALLAKQSAATERALRVENTKLQKLNEQLRDKFRDKCGTLLSSGEASEGALGRLRARERNYQATIHKLQLNNRQLLDEVLALKDELLVNSLGGASLHETDKTF